MYTDKPKNGEFEELAQLLKSWNVSELLPYLQEEAIDTQELQMLKRHHLNDLLRNFRYGTRIRFEHHLERWRRWLNVPLQDATGDDRQCSGGATNTATATSTTSSTVNTGNNNNSNNIIPSNNNVHCAGCRCSNGSALRHQHQQQQQQQQLIHSKSELLDESNKQLQHQQQQQQQHLQQQQQQQQHLQQQQQQLPSEPFVSLNEETEGGFNVPLPLSDHSELVHTELVTADLIKPEMNDIDSSEESGVTVLAILQASPVKAQSLLERLGHNEQLDAVQRLLLIQLICSYYEDNRLHLTLQRSHLLEREILQLFPKEQLCFYRTERRGKIYVRFTNMKRNKRFGSQREQKRRREESMAPPSSFVSKEVTFGGDPMSSPERSD